MTLELPWPPSINTYWRRVGNRTVLSAKARAYRAEAVACCLEQRAPRLGTARVRLAITAHAPDKRARDLDNLCKGILDSLEFARVFDNDEQIDELHVVRGAVTKPGQVLIHVEIIPAPHGALEEAETL